MPPRSTKRPISSYDPRLFALLIRGAEARIELVLESPAKATHFVQVLYELRKTLREAKAQNWELVSRCTISNFAKDATGRRIKSNVVVLRPYEDEYASIIDEALGDFAPELPEAPPKAQSSSPFDALLEGLLAETIEGAAGVAVDKQPE